MRIGRRAVAAGAGLLLLCLYGCGGRVTRNVVVDRYDVSVRVLADGALDLRETIAIRAAAAGGGSFVRDIATDRLDRISDIDATLDGRSAAEAGARIGVDRKGALHAAWPVPAAGPDPHRISLHYRVDGALALQGPRGVLRWAALPADRPYDVGRSHIDLSVPADAEIVVGPGLEGRAGAMTRGPGGATAELASVPARDAIVISAEILPGARSLAEPRWQDNAQRARDLMPAFVAAAVCLVGIGLGVLGMIRLQYPRIRTAGGAPETATPDAIAPAMAAAVVRNRLSANVATRLATVLDLARRGFLGLSADGVAAGPHSSDGEGRAPALAHERVLLSALRQHDGSRPLGLAEVTALVARIGRPFDRALIEDLQARGLVAADRLLAARGLRATAGAAVALGAVGAIVIHLTLARFGIWPQAMPASLIVVGALFLAAGAHMAVWTEAGGVMAGAWRARVAERRAVSQAGPLPSDEEFDAWLPVAVACGLSREWSAAWARRAPTPPPAALVLVRQYTSRL